MLILTIAKKIIVFYHIFAKYNFVLFLAIGSMYFCGLFIVDYYSNIHYALYGSKEIFSGYQILQNIPLVFKIIFYCICIFFLVYIFKYDTFKYQKWHNKFFIKPIFTYHFFRTQNYSIRSIIYDIYTISFWLFLLDIVFNILSR